MTTYIVLFGLTDAGIKAGDVRANSPAVPGCVSLGA
jgi:hypothetical protein